MIGLVDRKIAVIPIFDPDKSEGGIWIPDVAKERCDQGVVKYVANDCELVKPGDYVMFSGYTGTALQLDEGTFIIFREEFVVAKVEGTMVDNTEVPGLFFQAPDKTFFPATVEFGLELIAKALQEAPWRRTLKSSEMAHHRPMEAAQSPKSRRTRTR